jgi:hypothetical protein
MNYFGCIKPNEFSTPGLMGFNRTTLLRAGARFPSPAAVSAFVTELEKNWPTNGNQQKQPTTLDSIAVQTFNIGSKLRIRATDDGGVVEVRGLDGCWKSQVQWALSELTAPARFTGSR